MISYDTKDWVRLPWAWEGTVLPAIGVRLLLLFLLSIGVLAGYEVCDELLHVKLAPLHSIGHTLIGIALGLLVVFRTNASYDRFWEGRKMWGGIVNTTRNLARGAAVFAPPAKEYCRWIAAYPYALKQHLRGRTELDELRDLVPATIFEQMRKAANPPSVLAWHLSDWLRRRMAEGKLSPELTKQLESYVALLLDQQGACERILKTPIPFVYAVHIRHLNMLYMLTLPFVLIGVMGWATPFCVFAIGWGLLGIEEAGVEIEDPFGEDPNDLPLEAICETIQSTVLELGAERTHGLA